MTRKIFTMGAIALSTLLLAQTEEEKVVTTTTTTTTTTVTTPISSARKNDVMVDPFALLAGVASISYEGHINKDMGVGISAFFIVDDYVIKNGGYWYLLPHYRYYMGKKWARGFFVEGFAGVVGKKYEIYDLGMYGFHKVDEKWDTNFGIGFGIGGKWETKSNLLFEVSAGIGRAFGSDVHEPIFPKGIFGIGYRF